MKKLKDKKVLMVIGIILIIVVALVIIFTLRKEKENGINTRKLDKESVIKKQEEVTNLIKGYVDNVSNIKEYAKTNSKVEFSLKELRGIFDVDISSFKKLKYHCNEDTTFVKYDNNYNDYIIVLDCKDFYLK